MKCLRQVLVRSIAARKQLKHNQLRNLSSFSSQSSPSPLKKVPLLPSWDSEVFQAKAYTPALPFRLPRSKAHLPLACSEWFIHDGIHNLDPFQSPASNGDQRNSNDEFFMPRSSELRTSFWSEYEDTIVPLELTSQPSPSSIGSSEATFHRTEAPMKILLTYLSHPGPSQHNSPESQHSIYLAQCSLSSLPQSLQSAIPTPTLITRSGPIKGDIYASSLWLGRPPTYTPLHRDPNPNIFVQLAGQKIIRLLPPEVGDAVFEDVQSRIQHRTAPSSVAIRGEEMMSGPEKEALEDAIWGTPSSHPSFSSDLPPATRPPSRYAEILAAYAQETTLGMGDTLFIPKGWWHSVKGVGGGVTASANWWFR